MMDDQTKRRINSLRDILVGKVPDPKSQVEQITTALIYKFMSDMDRESIDLGGEPQFFADEWAKYSWSKLLDPKLGGQERMNLYTEGITSMRKNTHLPPLFREIFKDAFLPFRDPATLSLFLKEVNQFEYSHSEDLGDAYEYLLSIMGSQGDAGQFRTPRHIIDFIVDVVDPKKGEKLLDPACGTAGFLISAFKHIERQNKDHRLNPDERKALVKDFVGYDISPDMVRMSLVNMYLHGFANPEIHEYDSLSSEDRWDDKFDVIMANPPFMTPKGGIQPHKRFQVQANRAEVLFVDYIMEHLKPGGRAGIIVPEGIIFQEGGSYQELRRMLVHSGLYAVVSLPVGVFNPYTKTTKTSIIFLDHKVQERNQCITFINVKQDGFDLGSERFPIHMNDLPSALLALNEVNKGESIHDNDVESMVVPVSDILDRKGCNLAVWYDAENESHKLFSSIEIGKVLQQQKRLIVIDNERSYKQITVKMNGKGAVLRGMKKGASIKTKRQFEAKTGDFILSKIDARNGAFAIVPEELDGAIVTQDFPLFIVNEDVMLVDFLNIMMQSPQFVDICKRTSIGTSNRRRVKLDKFLSSQIPLPSLAVQRELIGSLVKHRHEIKKHKSSIKQLEQKIDSKITNLWLG